MELDFDRQRDAIYQPIAAVILAGWREATDPEPVERRPRLGGHGKLSRSSQPRGPLAAWPSGRRWCSPCCWWPSFGCWSGWSAAFAAAAFAARTGTPAGRPIEVGFYRRLETLLARQGLVRAAAQTQREFAAAAGGQLAARTGQAGLAGLPPLVAEAFYRVRFGLAPWTKSRPRR